MDNFKAVFRILSALESAMDEPSFDIGVIGPDVLGVSEERWARYIEMMNDVGYVKGVTVSTQMRVGTVVNARNIRITLKGLEYLQENSIMQKMYRAAKGISDLIP